MPSFSKGLTDEKAMRMLAAFRLGRTMRGFSLKAGRFEAYCNAHPEYGREALALLEANRRAANQRKAVRFRAQTHCKNGHTLSDARIYMYKGYRTRGCIPCRQMHDNRPRFLTPDQIERVKIALRDGATVGQICRGRPIGGGKFNPKLFIAGLKPFYGSRRADPEFNRFVLDALSGRNSIALKIAFGRKRNRVAVAAKRQEITDYQRVLAMLPTSFPDKDDVVGRIFESLLDGSLKREDVRARVKFYVAEHNRNFPTTFRKFGNSMLVSLDEHLFDGSATLGETVSRGLWD